MQVGIFWGARHGVGSNIMLEIPKTIVPRGGAKGFEEDYPPPSPQIYFKRKKKEKKAKFLIGEKTIYINATFKKMWRAQIFL